MDEHIQLTRGRMIELNGEFADDNLNNLSWWAHKHVNYAIREAVDLLDIEYDLTGAARLEKQLTTDALINVNVNIAMPRNLYFGVHLLISFIAISFALAFWTVKKDLFGTLCRLGGIVHYVMPKCMR